MGFGKEYLDEFQCRCDEYFLLGKSFQYFKKYVAESLHCSLPRYEVFYSSSSVVAVQCCSDDPPSAIDISAFLDW